MSAITFDFETSNNRKLVTHNGRINTSLDAMTSRVDGFQRKVKELRDMIGQLLSCMHKPDGEDSLRNILSVVEGKYNNAMLRKKRYKHRVVGYKNQLSDTIISPLGHPLRKKQRTKPH